MAAHLGLSQSMVSQVWRAFELAPHKQDSWKLSKDPLTADEASIYSETTLNSARAWSIWS